MRPTTSKPAQTARPSAGYRSETRQLDNAIRVTRTGVGFMQAPFVLKLTKPLGFAVLSPLLSLLLNIIKLDQSNPT